MSATASVLQGGQRLTIQPQRQPAPGTMYRFLPTDVQIPAEGQLRPLCRRRPVKKPITTRTGEVLLRGQLPGAAVTTVGPDPIPIRAQAAIIRAEVTGVLPILVLLLLLIHRSEAAAHPATVVAAVQVQEVQDQVATGDRVAETR